MKAEWEMIDCTSRLVTTTQKLRKVIKEGVDKELLKLLDAVSDIKQDTKKSASVLKTLGNMLKFGAKDLRD